MTRVLCGALLASAAFAVPAHAAPPDLSDYVHVYNNDYGYGVGIGTPGQPLVGVHHSAVNGTTCVGISEMVPRCVKSID